MQVQLSRDALSTPWGFRLQGGKDFKAPLTVQRVFVGSPADGELNRGDTILAIENYDATQMIHKQAQDLIKSSGGSINLTVRRGYPGGRSAPPSHQPQVFTPAPKHYGAAPQSFRSRPLDVKAPANYAGAQQSYGVDYTKGRPSRPQNSGPMLNRVQESLSNTLLEPGAHQGEEEYDYKPVSELSSMFKPAGRTPTHHHRKNIIYRRIVQPVNDDDNETEESMSVSELKSIYNKWNIGVSSPHQSRGGWKRPDAAATGTVGGGLKEPGWSPNSPKAPSQNQGWNAVKAPGYAPQKFNQPSGQYHPQPPQNQFSAPPAQHQVPSVVSTPPQQQQYYEQPPHIQEPATPAWAGSLKSSSSTKPWEVHAATALTGEGPAPYQGVVHESPLAPPPIQRQASPMSATAAVHNPRVQSVHYAPGQSPVYQQHDAAEPSDTARVVHLQYQSPLGLYSKENAQVALDAQTKGKPGEGTLAVMDADAAAAMQSDVYKMVHESDTRHGGQQQQQGYQAPQHYDEMGNGYPEEGVGASDF